MISSIGFIGALFIKETVNSKRSIAFDETALESDVVPLLDEEQHSQSKPMSKSDKLSKCKSNLEILKNKEVLLTSLLQAILGFSVIAFEEVFSVWSVNKPQDGGIAFSSSAIGIYFTTAGVWIILYQTVLFTPLVNKFKPLTVFRIGCVVLIAATALVPVSVQLVDVNNSFSLFSLFTFICSNKERATHFVGFSCPRITLEVSGRGQLVRERFHAHQQL